MGSAEEPSPFARSLRVSLRYTISSPFLARKGARSDDALLIETLDEQSIIGAYRRGWSRGFSKPS